MTMDISQKLTKEEAIELANLTKTSIGYAQSQNNAEMLRAFTNTMRAVCEVLELREQEELTASAD